MYKKILVLTIASTAMHIGAATEQPATQTVKKHALDVVTSSRDIKNIILGYLGSHFEPIQLTTIEAERPDTNIMIAVSPDNKYIASASKDGDTKVWDAHTYNMIQNLEQRNCLISTKRIYFTSDSKFLIVEQHNSYIGPVSLPIWIIIVNLRTLASNTIGAYFNSVTLSSNNKELIYSQGPSYSLQDSNLFIYNLETSKNDVINLFNFFKADNRPSFIQIEKIEPTQSHNQVVIKAATSTYYMYMGETNSSIKYFRYDSDAKKLLNYDSIVSGEKDIPNSILPALQPEREQQQIYSVDGTRYYCAYQNKIDIWQLKPEFEWEEEHPVNPPKLSLWDKFKNIFK